MWTNIAIDSKFKKGRANYMMELVTSLYKWMPHLAGEQQSAARFLGD